MKTKSKSKSSKKVHHNHHKPLRKMKSVKKQKPQKKNKVKSLKKKKKHFNKKRTRRNRKKKGGMLKRKRREPKPESRKKKKEQEEICSICLDLLNNRDEIITTDCSHTFHTNCLRSWCEYKTNCPNCRKDISPTCQILRLERGSENDEEIAREIAREREREIERLQQRRERLQQRREERMRQQQEIKNRIDNEIRERLPTFNPEKYFIARHENPSTCDSGAIYYNDPLIDTQFRVYLARGLMDIFGKHTDNNDPTREEIDSNLFPRPRLQLNYWSSENYFSGAIPNATQKVKEDIEEWFNKHATSPSIMSRAFCVGYRCNRSPERDFFTELKNYTDEKKNLLKEYLEKEFDCRISEYESWRNRDD